MSNRVIHTFAPEPCEKRHSLLLKVYYVGQSWIVDKAVCGKCGLEPVKKERFRWEKPVQESEF